MAPLGAKNRHLNLGNSCKNAIFSTFNNLQILASIEHTYINTKMILKDAPCDKILVMIINMSLTFHKKFLHTSLQAHP